MFGTVENPKFGSRNHRPFFLTLSGIPIDASLNDIEINVKAIHQKQGAKLMHWFSTIKHTSGNPAQLILIERKHVFLLSV